MRAALLRAIRQYRLDWQPGFAQLLDQRDPACLLLDQQAVWPVFLEAVHNHALECAEGHFASPGLEQDRVVALHLVALLVLDVALQDLGVVLVEDVEHAPGGPGAVVALLVLLGDCREAMTYHCSPSRAVTQPDSPCQCSGRMRPAGSSSCHRVFTKMIQPFLRKRVRSAVLYQSQTVSRFVTESASFW